jgi:DNA polymerase III delta subunit
MLYLLHGADTFRSSARLRELRAMLDPAGFNSVALDGQSPDVTVAALRSSCDALAFFGGGRCVDVSGLLTRWSTRGKGADGGRRGKSDDKEADPLAALVAYLPHLPATTTLIFWEPGQYDPPAPLRAVLRDAGAASEEFRPPLGRELREWTVARAQAAGATIRPDAVDALLDALCPQGWREAPRGRDAALPNLQRIDTEIQKLATAVLSREAPVITARVVVALTVGEAETNVFRLVDAVAVGDTRLALTRLHEALDSGLAPEMILALLQAKFSTMARVRSAGGAARHLGLSPYRVQETVRQIRQLGADRVPDCVRIVLAADEAIKTGRLARGDDALYWAVLELCRVGAPVPIALLGA